MTKTSLRSRGGAYTSSNLQKPYSSRMAVKTIALIIFDSAEAQWLIGKCIALAISREGLVIGLHRFSQVVFFNGMTTAPMVYATRQQ
jgi:hypothetical protein